MLLPVRVRTTPILVDIQGVEPVTHNCSVLLIDFAKRLSDTCAAHGRGFAYSVSCALLNGS